MKHEIFLKSKLNLHTSLTLHEMFSYIVSFPDFHCTEFKFAFALSAHTKNFHCLSSRDLNRLDVLIACHKLKPIGNAQNLSLVFI